jgi:oligoendopeptidase F
MSVHDFKRLVARVSVLGFAFLLSSCGTVNSQGGETSMTEEREQIAWDLTDLYATPEAWEQAYEDVLEQIAALPRYQGTLGRSPNSLAFALTRISEVQKEAIRVYIYTSLKSDEDQRVSESQERLSQSRAMFSEYSQAVSWVAPEIISIGEETIRAYMSEDPRLDPFDFYLEDLLANAEHTLGDEAEAVLAAVGIVLGSPNNIYELLVNADVPWPTIELSTGEEVFLNQAGYSRHRAAANREDRILVFDTFWSMWQEYLDSIGLILSTEVNANVATARVRNYDNVLQMQLSEENIPTQVYDTLVEEVNASLPTLHRYFELRGQMLGVDQMYYYDIYPPLIELDLVFDIETSRDITLEALEPLGTEYTGPMEAVANSDWLHVYPQPGKRSGAYMNGSGYDVHPYVLLNHNDDFNSMSTYAHELGHAVHTLLTTAVQPFEKSDYSTFIAEIASQINEILLEEYMIANAESDEERLFYLGYSLESMRGSFYRQTMFSEFEHAIHKAVEAGEPLSGERMNEIYGDLLKTYHGHDEGVLLIDDTYTAEWAYIPHFYYDFYVYQYSTSIAGAAWFAERLLAGDQEVQRAFIELLQAGGSDYPYELLKTAGLDMASPEPYRAAVRRMDSVMDRIETILAN